MKNVPAHSQLASQPGNALVTTNERALRMPKSFILDLAKPLEDYQKRIKCIRGSLQTDPGKVIDWITCYLSDKASARDDLWNSIADIENELVGAMPDNHIGCFTNAVGNLGDEIVSQLEQYGLYHPGGETFGYYFCGFATDGAAVFKTRD